MADQSKLKHFQLCLLPNLLTLMSSSLKRIQHRKTCTPPFSSELRFKPQTLASLWRYARLKWVF